MLDVRLGCVNLLLSMELCVGVGVVIRHIPTEVLRVIEHFLSSLTLFNPEDFMVLNGGLLLNLGT